jgi:Alpha/beta hydrolase domain
MTTVTNPVATPVSGKPNLLLGAFDIAELSYTAQEFFVSGNATSYSVAGKWDSDGHWRVNPSETAEFVTRLVVLTPVDPSVFNGTVLVEWLNVSGGIDAPAVWMMAHREIVREGYAYVAVSVQQVGVQGGTSMGPAGDMSLKKLDPERYAPLRHPGDAYAFDIFSQVGRLVRDSGDGEVGQGLLGALTPEFVVAVGESQSAMFLTTYVNAVDHVAGTYDGFLVHSRFGSSAPLDGSSIFESSESSVPEAVRFRSDGRVPVLTVITETDLIGGLRHGYHLARQPDTDTVRTWEIPGTAHADNYTIKVGFIDTGFAPLAAIVAAYAPTNVLMGQQLDHFINFAPQHHYVLQAAIAALHRWVRTGEPAPVAARIELTDIELPQPVLDANGVARGGVRTPWVDVPIARTAGSASTEIVMSLLFGTGEPFDQATLRRLYPGGADDYLEHFTKALDGAIGSRFLVPADRQEILDLARAVYAQSAELE